MLKMNKGEGRGKGGSFAPSLISINLAFSIIQVSSQSCLHASVANMPQIILFLLINLKRCFAWS